MRDFAPHPPARYRPGLAVCGMAALLLAVPAAAADPLPPAEAPAAITDEAARIYKNYGDALYQVQVIDLASGKKTGIGSGFQFNTDGMIATNYHVVADAIQHPRDNRLEYLHDKYGKGSLRILTADVTYDLAILQMESPGPHFVTLGESSQPRGTRVFSLGNPHDIGFTIVEGTYNGISRDGLIDKIHFSGAINAGMSGGPALDHAGRVIGVNVATAGNQIGFLVPVEPLRDMMLAYLRQPEGYDYTAVAAATIESQLLKKQAENVARVLAGDWEGVPFGRVAVPARVIDAFKCWGGAQHKETDEFTHFYSACSTEDRIYIDNRFTTGLLSYRYDQIKAAETLDTPRFYALYRDQYGMAAEPAGFLNARKEDVTKFECADSFTDAAGERWKASSCLRRYRKYPSLYDLHIYMAMTGHAREGMIVSFTAQGVARDSALQLARKFMGALRPVTPDEAGATPKLPEQEDAGMDADMTEDAE